ncbi:MAG TPA: hypothetical protein VEO54_03040 [Thermoanaerobaculia bacterium]|nr:hypothetical protein [Thermoanaerobaculia bacterium]
MTARNDIRFAKRLLLPGAAVLCLLAAIAPLTHAAPPEPLTLTFEPRGAVIEGVTPGGVLVVFARARNQIQLHYAESVALKFMLRDKAGSGRITVDAGRELPADAVWAVVDLETGRHLVSSRGLARERRPLPADTVRYKPQDRDRLSVALPMAEILVVRRGENAWFEAIGDGGTADEDGRTDGTAAISPAKLRNLRKKAAKPFDKVKKGDLVIVIDPLTLQVWSSAELGQ